MAWSGRNKSSGGTVPWSPSAPDNDVAPDYSRLDLRYQSTPPAPINAGIMTVYADTGANTASGYGMLRYSDNGGTSYAELPPYLEGIVTTGNLSDGTNQFLMGDSRVFWTRIGNQVNASGYLQWTGKGSATGNIDIRNALPFAAVTNSPMFYTGTVAGTGMVMGAGRTVIPRVSSASDRITLLVMNFDTGANFAFPQDTEFSTAGVLYFQISYRAQPT